MSPSAQHMPTAASRTAPAPFLRSLAITLDELLELLGGKQSSAPPTTSSAQAPTSNVAMFDTDWERLSPVAQHQLACCSVFRGPFDLDRASRIVAFSTPVVRDALSELVQASMLHTSVGDNRRCLYRMPVPLRRLAAVKLNDLGGSIDVRRRHAGHIADVFAEQFPIARPDVFDRFGWNETLAAMHWALETDPALGIRLAGNLWPQWRRLGVFGTGRDLLARALDASDAAAPGRARVMVGVGVLAADEGDALTAADSAMAGADAASAAGDYAAEAIALAEISWMALLDGCGDGASEYAERALDCSRRSGLAWGEAYARLARARVRELRDEPADALEDFAAGLALAVLVGDPTCAANAKIGIGRTTLLLGDSETAMRNMNEAHAEAAEIGDSRVVSSALIGLGLVTKVADQWDDARAHLQQAVEVAGRSDDPVSCCTAVLELASVGGRGAIDGDGRDWADGGDAQRSFDDLVTATRSAFEANAYVLLPQCYAAVSAVAVDLLGAEETDWLRRAASCLQDRFSIASGEAITDEATQRRIRSLIQGATSHPMLAPFEEIIRWFSDDAGEEPDSSPASTRIAEPAHIEHHHTRRIEERA